MTFPKLLLYIAITIIGFWLLGFAIEIAAWAIYIAMLIVLVLFILWLIQKWYVDYQGRHTATKTRKKRSTTKAASTVEKTAAKTEATAKKVKKAAKTAKKATAKTPAKPRRKSTKK